MTGFYMKKTLAFKESRLQDNFLTKSDVKKKPWAHGVNGTYIRRSEDVHDV